MALYSEGHIRRTRDFETIVSEAGLKFGAISCGGSGFSSAFHLYFVKIKPCV